MPTRKKKEPEKKTRTRYQVSCEQFCLVWNSSNRVAEVSERTGMPQPVVLARASKYRLKGINLKQLERPRRIDVERLNGLLRELEQAADLAKKGENGKVAIELSPEVCEQLKKFIKDEKGRD